MFPRPNPFREIKEARIAVWRKSFPDGGLEQAPFGLNDLIGLERAIQGKIVIRSDTGYDNDRQVYHPRFSSFPFIIAYCELDSDVFSALAFARKFALRVTCRSGGHSSAGWSADGQMILDTSRLDNFHIDRNTKRLTVGAGMNFEKLGKVLGNTGLHMPTGGCGGVCLAGFMQGGGYGFTSREFGMNCDCVLSAKVMLANGDVLVVDKTQNSDLLWAVCGGTGNSFGVLLEITYQLHELGDLWGFALRWDDKTAAAAALVELQKNYMTSGASPKLGYQAGLVLFKGEPRLILRGMFNGSDSDGRAAIASLLAIGDKPLVMEKRGSYHDLNEFLLDHPTPLPNVPGGLFEDKRSNYIAEYLTQSDWLSVINRFADQPPNPFTNIGIEPYGGAINAFPSDGNAFVHRNVHMNFFVEVFWESEKEAGPTEDWLSRFMTFMAPFGTGQAYQNYPSPSQSDERQRFWGHALPRLEAVKRKYDPENFFNHSQSVSPA